MDKPPSQSHRRRIPAVPVFLAVLIAQLALVAVAGTDIPFQDQWDIEGRWLYPAWLEGSLRWADLLRPFNEHRIVWTHLLNLALFAVNGQWDPLVQLTAIAFLRAACAAGLAWMVARGRTGWVRAAVAAAVVFAFLPHLAWHNALWGIESHAYFVLGLSLLAMALLGARDRSSRQTAGGMLAAAAALVAMGPGVLVPVALLGLAVLRAWDSRGIDPTPGASPWRQVWPAVALLAAGGLLRVRVPEHAALSAADASQFFTAAGRVLAWPHVGQPLAAIPMNLPLLALILARARRWRKPAPGEDFVLLAAGWSVGVALATAWVRGGSEELIAGVPSRYVDFIVLLPLANVWCAAALAHEAARQARVRARILAAAWGLFLFVGWLGLSAETFRGVILPRARDREAPVRLIRAFQLTGDAALFAGQPRLLVPHPNPESVRVVLLDPRMRGSLPPSLQPERPRGPLSRAVRALLGRQ